MDNKKIFKLNKDKVVKESGVMDEHQHGEDFKLWKLIVIMVPFLFAFLIMLYNFGVENALLEWMKNPWWSFSLATFSVIIFNRDLFNPIVHSIHKRSISDVSFLLSISIIVTYIYSIVMMGIDYNDPSLFISDSLFEATVEIIAIVNIGYFINNVIEKRVQKTIVDTDSMFSKISTLIDKDGNEKEVPSDTLVPGNVVSVKNGMKIPADGVIIEGNTTIDESMFTGESIPVDKKIGSKVYAATISEGEKILVKITNAVNNSMLSKVLDSINKTQNQKSSVTSISKILEKIVIPFIFIVSLLALIFWSIFADFSTGIEVFVTTLIVACPMVFVLLTPTSSLMASSVAFKKGFTFNSTDIFTKYKSIDAIVFDKTGTLTYGDLSIVNVNLSKEHQKIVKSMEDISAHPVAKSIVSYLKDVKKIKIDSKEISGNGIEAKYKNDIYRFGSYEFVSKKGDKEDSKNILLRQNGFLLSYLSVNNEVVGYIELRDEINPTSISMIKELKKMNMEVYMLTGDNIHTAKYIASEIGINESNVFANVNPLEKQEKIKELKKIHNGVSFVGDGINDAIALETSDLGISVYQGSDLAVSSSTISVNSHNNNTIPFALKLCGRTRKTINIGFLISSIWIVGIMLFSSVAYPLVPSLMLIGPALGAVAMVFNDVLPVAISTTILTMNFKRLTTKK